NTVSTVNPGPNRIHTPVSPSPVVFLPSSNDFFLISSRINTTQALDMFPYSLNTCLLALSFSSLTKFSFDLVEDCPTTWVSDPKQ
ncbi:hypothetical protein GIB67_007569, partial [Kingdonia uniflora]